MLYRLWQIHLYLLFANADACSLDASDWDMQFHLTTCNRADEWDYGYGYKCKEIQGDD